MRPSMVFDREREWDALARQLVDRAPHPTLAVVYGRRRQGKSFLLRALCGELAGFYFEAPEATEAETLRLLGRQLAEWLGAPAPLALADWSAALAALMKLGHGRSPVTVVLDELPRLAAATPSLPSLIQGVLPPRLPGVPRSIRLVLCGSALSFMTRLLSGEAPLRGRASLELLLQPFDFRQAAEYWGLSKDPALALRVFAVVGGTPAYRREFVSDDTPRGPRDFDAWILRTALSPTVPLFREGRYLLAEEPDIRDLGLHHSVLAAIADGQTSRGAIAAALGRASTDVGHPLAVLEDAGFIERRRDAFRSGGSTWRLVEPIVRFHHAILRPSWAAWQDRTRARVLWRRARSTFDSLVLGPAFEEVCRTFVARHAAPETTGGPVAEVLSGTIQDPTNRTRHEVDIAAFGLPPAGGRRRLLLIGEAKSGHRFGRADLGRLERIRELLRRRDDLDATACRLALFSGVGFDGTLQSSERAGDVILVDPARLYRGE